MLSALIGIPLLGAVIIGFCPGITPRSARWGTLAIATLMFVWTIALASQFDLLSSTLQFEEHLSWLDTLGLTYHLGIDGLSSSLLVLNGLLTGIAIYSTTKDIHRPRLYYALMLLLNAAVAGAFLAHDLLLFFLFYELELLPLYLLINIWGGARREYAATKFLIFTSLSGMCLLVSFLGVVGFTGASTFAYDPTLAAMLPLETQMLLLLPILLGFAIKVPLVPFHTWLPDAHVEASTPVSVLLAGVLLKLGTYGLLRFGVGLFPAAWTTLAPWLAAWAVVSVLFGILAAIAQTDMKKMVAYSSVGHMGFILLAAAAATPLSLLGAVVQMVSHGLISGLLFLLVGVVYVKTGTRSLDTLKGLLNPERGLPVVGSLMVLAVMASAGIPGMAGFVAEFLIFRGSFAVFPAQTLLCMVGTGLTAVYFLVLLNRAFFGRLSSAVIDLPRVSWSERLPAAVLAAIIILLGIQPSWLIGLSEAASAALEPTTRITDASLVISQPSTAPPL
ncbi:MAG: NADH-quinone oxidoreductase subunit M [Trichocoleus desertorum ATA4-8-CV12]|nr:NADH-quinone oxidoreductase subunit M [Trichocoleus desertorum ATA4-8-CV12]